MKKPILWTAAVAALTMHVLFAQDTGITGDWQGTLHTPGGDQRVVFRISDAEAGSIQATIFMVDTNGQSFPGNPVTLRGSSVRISVPGMLGNYEGQLSADGNTLEGGMRTPGPTLPLSLTRATDQTAWRIPQPPPEPAPMARDADPVFEVATIKPNESGQPGVRIQTFQRFRTANTSLKALIKFAYGLHDEQIEGGPGWMDSDRYDILAQPEGEGEPSAEQWRAMIRKLLEDRFALAYHTEKRELSVFTIVVDESGLKMAETERRGSAMFQGNFGVWPANGIDMPTIAQSLQDVVLDRPVLDRTGLAGRYSFTLNWTPDGFQFPNAPQPPPAQVLQSLGDRPDLFTAMRQQLGLKLESTKALVDVMVIDAAEKPSAN